jgi:hypothetical protein
VFVVSGSVVFKLHIQGVSAMLRQNSVGSFPHRNEKKKFISIICLVAIFEVQPNNVSIYLVDGARLLPTPASVR